MGSFDVEISYHNLLNWTTNLVLGIILVTIGMFLKLQQYLSILGAWCLWRSYFDHCLNEHIGKVVAIATLFKLLTIMNADISPAFQLIIVIISMASIGNIMALRQVNVKRILAFSGISHAGFMLMTLLNTTNTAGTLLYYTCLCISRNRCLQCNYICLQRQWKRRHG
jgi:NADH-quinone oxidoreductase subunit N